MEGELGDNEIEPWEEELAEAFVIDSAGHFTRVGGLRVRAQQILDVTKRMQERLRAKRDAFAGLVDLGLSSAEFGDVLEVGGIGLTRELAEIVCVEPMTFSDWVARFSWEPMQAASELQRVLAVWARRRARPSKRRSTRFWRQVPVPVASAVSLSFWDFHGVLTEMGVDWLTLHQQRLLFRCLDVDHNGRVDIRELQALSDRRADFEMLRDQELQEEEERGDAAPHTAAGSLYDPHPDGPDGPDGPDCPDSPRQGDEDHASPGRPTGSEPGSPYSANFADPESPQSPGRPTGTEKGVNFAEPLVSAHGPYDSDPGGQSPSGASGPDSGPLDSPTSGPNASASLCEFGPVESGASFPSEKRLKLSTSD